MDQELIDYIINHYSVLLTLKEKAAQKHYLVTLKTANAKTPEYQDMLMRTWGAKDPEVLALLGNGYDEFKRRSADKVLKEHKDKVFINTCPKCGRLARTPLAKQCRYCRHDWH